MKIDLSGKTAIVTGSTGGIGFAIANGLAACGAEVVVNGRSQASVSRAISDIKAAVPDGLVSGFTGDLASADSCSALVEEHPLCDILVNNLGIYEQADFFETSDDVWRNYFETNVLSGVRLCRSYVPGMQKKEWGRIVFLSSESGLSIPPDQIHYGVSKTAQISVARGLAKRLTGSGITVNSVLPGPTLTGGVARLLKADAEGGEDVTSVAAQFIKDHRPSSIIQRAATAREVANMVVYTCSQQASATTGAALRVDGGIVDCI